MMHLSRLSEDLILWSSDEFGFVRLGDDYTTGSSMMPQKRNPDYAELIRGRTGRVYGNLVALLTTLKGRPLTYTRDLQEDKEGTFDTVDTILSCLEVGAQMLASMSVDGERMRAAAEFGSLLTTDYADYLTKKGMPFRDAHGIMSDLTKHAISVDRSIKDFSLKELKEYSELFEDDVLSIDVDSSIDSRDLEGGTARGRVADAITSARNTVAAEIAESMANSDVALVKEMHNYIQRFRSMTSVNKTVSE
jgi:argininosuccinate lyase